MALLLSIPSIVLLMMLLLYLIYFIYKKEKYLSELTLQNNILTRNYSIAVRSIVSGDLKSVKRHIESLRTENIIKDEIDRSNSKTMKWINTVVLNTPHVSFPIIEHLRNKRIEHYLSTIDMPDDATIESIILNDRRLFCVGESKIMTHAINSMRVSSKNRIRYLQYTIEMLKELSLIYGRKSITDFSLDNINKAQQRFIEELSGTKFYAQIKDVSVERLLDVSDMTNDFKELLNFSQPAMLIYSMVSQHYILAAYYFGMRVFPTRRLKNALLLMIIGRLALYTYEEALKSNKEILAI